MYEKHVMWTRPRAYWFAVFSAERRAERAAKAARLALVVIPNSTVRYSVIPDRTIVKISGARRDKLPPLSASIRTRLFEAQGGLCYLCGAYMHAPTEDHVVPKALGGKNRANRLLSCSSCNNRKANRPPYACELLALRAFNLRVVHRARAVTPEDAQEARVRLPAAVPSPDPAPPSEPVP